MLLPRFTLRTILVATTLAAVVFVFVGTAYRGQTWAWGATIGILSLAVMAFVHAAFYGIISCFARLSKSRREDAA